MSVLDRDGSHGLLDERHHDRRVAGSRLWLPLRITARGRMHLAFRVGRTPFHGPGYRTRCGRFIDELRATLIVRRFRYDEVDCRWCGR